MKKDKGNPFRLDENEMCSEYNIESDSYLYGLQTLFSNMIIDYRIFSYTNENSSYFVRLINNKKYPISDTLRTKALHLFYNGEISENAYDVYHSILCEYYHFMKPNLYHEVPFYYYHKLREKRRILIKEIIPALEELKAKNIMLYRRSNMRNKIYITVTDWKDWK